MKTFTLSLILLIAGIGMLLVPVPAFATFIYPETYGASGAGNPASASANTAAINSALSYAANTGDTVVLNGVYYVNGQINARSGETLAASGTGGVIKAVANMSHPSNGYLLRVNGRTGFTMDGVELDGNRTNQTQDDAHTYGGIVISGGSSNVTIENSKVHDFNGITGPGALGLGIRTNVASNCVISNNQIYSNNGGGVSVYYSSSGIQVLNNTIWDNTQQGIEAEGRNGTNYTNYRNSSITLTGNVITSPTEALRRIGAQCILVDWTDGAVVSSNQCTACGSGIESLGCTNVTVSSNYCTYNGNAGDNRTGVFVTAETYGENGRSSAVSMVGNQIAGFPYGISVDTATGATASGNTITAPYYAGLLVDSPGAPTLSLNGTNTYSGGTAVYGGTLLVTNTGGSGTGSGGVTVNAGTLGGSGTIAGPVIVAGGATLAPGTSTSVGILTINNSLTLGSGSLFAFKLGAVGASDEVSMASSLLSLDDQQFGDFTFTALSGFSNHSTYVLFDAGTITGSLGTNVFGTVDGLPCRLAVSGNDLVLVVPEPGMWALLSTGLLGLLAHAWRKRRQSGEPHDIGVNMIGARLSACQLLRVARY